MRVPAVLAAVILGLIAAGCLGQAGSEVAAQRAYGAHGRQVPAVVQAAAYVRGLGSVITVRLEGGRAGSSGNAGNAGEVVTIADPNGAPAGLHAGQQVTVLYDTSRPDKAVFPSQLSWTRPALLGGIGIVALLLAIGRAFALLRRGREARPADGVPEGGFPGWGAGAPRASGGEPAGYVDRSGEPLFPKQRR